MGRLLDKISSLEAMFLSAGYNVLHVNADNDGGDGTKANPFETFEEAIDEASAKTALLVWPLDMAAGATDPESYTENIVIPAAKSNMLIYGINWGRTQGGLPQLKVGTITTQAILTVRAPGCRVVNIGINGIGGTGGGILLDDNGSTKTAFGSSIENCHLKNCVGPTATSAATGGAIQWGSGGGAWQSLIKGNRFYKNVGDVVLLGTGTVPQDIVIEDNVFSGPAANVDCQLYLAGGDGMNGVIIKGNFFTAFPALGSGAVLRFIDATGCIGMLANNYFAGLGTTAGYGVGKIYADIPTTMLMAHNYSEGGLILREA